MTPHQMYDGRARVLKTNLSKQSFLHPVRSSPVPSNSRLSLLLDDPVFPTLELPKLSNGDSSSYFTIPLPWFVSL